MRRAISRHQTRLGLDVQCKQKGRRETASLRFPVGSAYSLLRLFRWLSVSRSLTSAADNFGRSIVMLSFTILPVKANGCACRKLDPDVMMVQSAEDRQRKNACAAYPATCAFFWC